jgi:hypothetical protein
MARFNTRDRTQKGYRNRARPGEPFRENAKSLNAESLSSYECFAFAPGLLGGPVSFPPMSDWFAFIIIAIVALTAGTLWAQRRLPPALANLFVAGLCLRVAGSIARLQVIEQLYSGVGDAKMYFEAGRMYADQIRSFDFGFVLGEGTLNGQWWGTQFIRSLTGFVVLLTGESFQAGFLVFALFSFTGLVLCARAFGAACGPAAELAFARWVWLWPSLCFWPSSIGKDAVMVLGAGLAAFGYVGGGQSRRWLYVGAGVALCGAIRPHVAAVVAGSVLAAESVTRGAFINVRRIAGIIVAMALVAYSVRVGLDQLGLGDADLEGLQEQFDFRAGQTEQGGSRIAIASGWSAVPMALVTIMARPFPWEARGIAILSAAEMTLFWGIAGFKWRRIWAFLRNWRDNAFARFAFPLVIGISLMYGLAFANLGIIARQRSVILPFMMTLLAASSLGRLGQQAPTAAPARLVTARGRLS